MLDTPQIAEIPETMRSALKSNIEQSKKAVESILSVGQKSVHFMDVLPLSTTLKNLNGKIAEYAQQNADANFRFAIKLADARQISDAVELQNAHIGETVDRVTKQFEDLRRLMTDVVKQSFTSVIPNN